MPVSHLVQRLDSPFYEAKCREALDLCIDRQSIAETS
jgi:ABC-type oligopeptide transport system substrate-binding subunit